ncbi:GNAT family N-acetyltransferase [Streptomyces sp. NPDC046261]|uniref:GNAT family N-acetyltransferase n=1 Tax=Streptomyces sp. NPDC046261 TaxID=3157200 RepID=UPI0033DC9C9A
MFTVERLGPQALGLLLDLQERIHAALPDGSVFQRSSADFLSYCLAEGGRCYAVRHRGETVAYRVVYFPRDREFNLAKDVPLPAEEYARVAHWDTIAVLPRWRGHRLSALMNARALSDLRETGIRHLFATSSPRNPHGVRSLIAAGFRPVRLVVKFGGNQRFLFYRPFPGGWEPAGDDAPDDAQDHTGGKLLPLSATGDLEAAFGSGWIGTDLHMGVANATNGTDGTAPRLRMRRRSLPFGT